jgi:hypothetical protein
VHTATADKVDTGIGETVKIPVKLNSTGSIWGVLAQVDFDTDVLEFTGFENNGIFTPEEFTTQNDMTKSYFRFLAANDKLENVRADGTLINMLFKVKDGADYQAYDVNVDVVQAIDVDGNVKEFEVTNGWVNVTEPTTAPPTTEPTDSEDDTNESATEEATDDTTEEETLATEVTATEKPSQQNTEHPEIADGDRNTTFNMILMFIAVCSAGVFVMLRRKKSIIE